MLSTFFLILLMLPYVSFGGYALPDFLNTILDILKFFSIFFAFFFYLKQKKYSPIVIIIALYQLLLLASTILNHGQVYEQFKLLLTIVSICMIFDIGIRKNPTKFFRVISFFFCGISLLCIITMFIYYPHGMFVDIKFDNNYYLLGQDNASFFDILPSIAYLGIYEILKKNKITFKVLIYTFIVFIGFMYVNSTTALVCLIFILLFELTSKLKFWNKILSYRNIFIFSIVAFVLLMFVGVSNISFLVYFVQEKLGKSLTLTGRTIIWQKALFYISKSPFFGYGFEDTILLIKKFNINHVHNIVLQILYNGGIIGTCLFFMINYETSKKMKKYKNTIMFKLILFLIFIFFIAAQFDYYNRRILIYTLFVIGYNIMYLMEEKVNENKKIN